MQNDKDKEIHDAHPISPESYLRNKMSNDNQPQTDDKFDKHIDLFAQLYQYKHSIEMDMERKDTMANTNIMQPPRHTNLEHSETIR